MKTLILLGLGGAAGFVVGARAGRPTYERIERTWTEMTRRTGLDDLASSARDAAVDVRDLAVDRASQVMSQGADDLARRIDDLAPGSAASPMATSSP